MRTSLPPPPLPNHALEGSVAATVRGLGAAVRPSEIWRSAAFTLLRLNPKECEALGLVFEDDKSSDERRLLVLDLLAGAGSFEAQVVIRRLLALQLARRDSRQFAMFVQRLGIVESPDGPTLRFLMSVYAESRNEPPDVRAACAYALGAAAGHALAAGERDAAIRASDAIRRDLLSVATPAEKCALVTALGNAAVPTDVMVITRFTVDAEPSVRAAAALALRKLAVPEARTQLIQLVADRDLKVSQSALAALTEQKLDDEELEKLSEQVLDGRTPMGMDLRVLRLMVSQRPRIVSVAGRACLLENALRLLLGRVEAQASVDGSGSGSGERRVTFPPPNLGPQSVTSASGSLPAQIKTTLEHGPIPPPPTMQQRAYVHHTPLPYAPNESQIVGPMAGMPIPTVPRAPAMPTVIGPTPESVQMLNALASEASSALPDTRRVLAETIESDLDALDTPTIDAPTKTMDSATRIEAVDAIDATMSEEPPTAYAPTVVGAPFRLVNPGDSVETVRQRMLALGLDPDARASMIPQPPPRRESSSKVPTHMGVGPMRRKP